ncbi:hypothetical protein IWW57_006703, partial [Coemansia sp. S610]
RAAGVRDGKVPVRRRGVPVPGRRGGGAGGAAHPAGHRRAGAGGPRGVAGEARGVQRAGAAVLHRQLRLPRAAHRREPAAAVRAHLPARRVAGHRPAAGGAGAAVRRVQPRHGAAVGRRGARGDVLDAAAQHRPAHRRHPRRRPHDEEPVRAQHHRHGGAVPGRAGRRGAAAAGAGPGQGAGGGGGSGAGPGQAVAGRQRRAARAGGVDGVAAGAARHAGVARRRAADGRARQAVFVLRGAGAGAASAAGAGAQPVVAARVRPAAPQGVDDRHARAGAVEQRVGRRGRLRRARPGGAVAGAEGRLRRHQGQAAGPAAVCAAGGAGARRQALAGRAAQLGAQHAHALGAAHAVHRLAWPRARAGAGRRVVDAQLR